MKDKTMKTLSRLLFVISVLFIVSCGEDNPVDPTPQIKTLSTSGYGFIIEPEFYKIWSDSSWDRYNGIVVVNNKQYVSMLNSEGTEYYYNSIGYAGFKPVGENAIIFNTPITSIPDTLLCGIGYAKQTTFYFQSHTYTIIIERTLVDTQTVTIGLGTYFSCLLFHNKGTIKVSNQSETVYSDAWLAKGPSDIKITADGTTKEMVEGKVNNTQYGGQNSQEFPLKTLIEKNVLKPQHFFYKISRDFAFFFNRLD